jgi:predicted phage tail protein
MLKTVKLYGELGDKFGKDWKFDIDAPIEAIGGLIANNAEFRQFVSESESRGVGYKIIVGKSYIEDETELLLSSGADIIKIVPTVLGAKSSVGKIIVGVVMILIYIYCQACATAIGSSGSFGYSVYMAVASNLIISGVVELLAPTPKDAEFAELTDNFGFSGSSNTVRQGVPVPVCYGQLMVGGAVISAGIIAESK